MKPWKLTIGRQNSKPFINLYFEGKRYRYWSGNVIGVKLNASSNSELLKSAFELKLLDGWKPKKKERISEKPLLVSEVIHQGIKNKIAQGCSKRFIKDAERVAILWNRFEKEKLGKRILFNDLKAKHIEGFLIRPNWSPKTQRTVKSTLSPLLSHQDSTIVSNVKLHKAKSKLHKPINDISKVLEELAVFNEKLFSLCQPHFYIW